MASRRRPIWSGWTASATRRVSGAWAALSAACHHHGYELSPTAGELRALYNEVRLLTEHLGPVSPPT
ncbi:hypothetical protein OG339_25550 [Streptosporangium sp. NBC_01495]|uniref:hypothetical protein n=1 Tax=Streptosporangium sp. NBC_01495 TaxID=2903899 RepID=UPI002E33D9EB|nr:hypothetical protein [Streptosporangium sp. NBC_01495]